MHFLNDCFTSFNACAIHLNESSKDLLRLNGIFGHPIKPKIDRNHKIKKFN